MQCLIGVLADAGMADDWGWVPADPRFLEPPAPAVRDADDATVRALFDDIVRHLGDGV
jgi:hypothetical protein